MKSTNKEVLDHLVSLFEDADLMKEEPSAADWIDNLATTGLDLFPGDANPRQKSFVAAYKIRKHPFKDGFLCTDKHRADTYTEAEDQGTFIESLRVLKFKHLLDSYPVSKHAKMNFPLNIQANEKWNLPDLAPKIIEAFKLPIAVDQLSVHNKGNYYKQYYLWPSRILDSLGLIRYGRTSWRRCEW
jgi:hypothetical protein